MRRFLTTTALIGTIGAAGSAVAEPQPYTIDPNHTEVLFTWSHGDFSTTRGIFFGGEGEVMFDEAEPANSSVSITIPMDNLAINGELRDHLMSDDFFGDNSGDPITFESTSISVTDDESAEITGDLTLNGQTQEVVLEAELNDQGEGPMGDQVIGFEAETTIMRSNFGLGAMAPFVSDELDVTISLEASPAS